ncbi:MAG: class I SAM-dependent methyltransferase [Gammaproteobacteria bacterium]
MANLGVAAAIAVVQQQAIASAAESELAQALAAELLPASQLASSPCSFFLRFDSPGLGLFRNPPGKSGAVMVDFGSRRLQHRAADSLRSQGLLKAAGIKAGYFPAVLDATAGLGRDAYLFASAGCPVLMIERSPLLLALLQDGLRRGAALAAVEAAAVARLSLQGADFLTADLSSRGFDVVYLDPMFPEEKQRALARKELQLLKEILGPQHGAGMLARARSLAEKRIVVKRGSKSPWLDDAKPDFSLDGRSSRYDVYLA